MPLAQRRQVKSLVLLFSQFPARNGFKHWPHFPFNICTDHSPRFSFLQTIKFYKNQIHPFHTPNNTILPSIIKASSSPNFLHFGTQLHTTVLKTGSIQDTFIANSLITMYGKCHQTNLACKLFDEMPTRDFISWNALINCLLQNGYVSKAIKKLKEMCRDGIEVKSEVIASVLSCCGRMGLWRVGRQIHCRVVVNGEIVRCVYVSTALVDMYSRWDDLRSSYEIFKCMEGYRNEVSWTAMIDACSKKKLYDMSIDLFRKMLVEEFITPNSVTLIAILPAYGELSSLKHVKQIHGYAVRRRYENKAELATALMDVYCKCGSLDVASLILERVKNRDVVMWSLMIAKYSDRGDMRNAITLFNRMRTEGINPNPITLLAIITPSCGNHEQAIHGYTVKTGFLSELYIGSALIDMYAKCGTIKDSQKIFKEIPTRDLVSWSSLIGAYGLYGESAEALRLFYQMQEIGIEPDDITFLSILSACSHGGLIEEGRKIFEQMQKDDKIDPKIEHFGCYINLLGRTGNIEDACNIISNMPMKASPTIWSSLVSACKVHGRLDVAKKLVDQLIDSEPDNPSNYTLSCMVYSELSDWHGAEEVQRIMRERGLKKESGQSHLCPRSLY